MVVGTHLLGELLEYRAVVYSAGAGPAHAALGLSWMYARCRV